MVTKNKSISIEAYNKEQNKPFTVYDFDKWNVVDNQSHRNWKIISNHWANEHKTKIFCREIALYSSVYYRTKNFTIP